MAKVGDILYWTGCAVAAIIAIFVAAFLALSSPAPDNWSMATSDLGIALGIWVIGLLARYLLAGTRRRH